MLEITINRFAEKQITAGTLFQYCLFRFANSGENRKNQEMYQKLNNNKNEQNIQPNSQIDQEIQAENKDISLFSGIGNEAVYQLLNGDDPSGNGSGNGKHKSLMVEALTDPKLSNGDIKDIVLPKKPEKKAEDQNIQVPQAVAPQEIGGLYEDLIAFQACFGENFKEEDLFKNDDPNEIDTRSAETRMRDILDAYKAKMRKEREEKAKKDQGKKAEPPKPEPKAGEPEKKTEKNNKPGPQAAIPQKKKQLFYKDPENVNQDDSYETEPEDDMVAVLDPNESQEVSYLERRNSGLDDDLIVHTDTLEKKPEKSSDRNQAKVEKDMYPVKDWNFTGQKMEEVQTTGGFAKFRNKLGRFFSGVFGFISSGFGIKQWIAGIRRNAAKKKKGAIQSKIQDKKDHSLIPGWEGEKFAPEANSGEDILADFRRVPTVWSQLIGDTASEGEGKDQKPLPPTITIYVDQPKDNSNQTMVGAEMGHTMIGIEYSRYSHLSKQYERYKLQYGFYPVVSVSKSTTFAMLNHDAIIPGQMMDDSGHSYTVSRRYPATAKQVNAILKASETYADGGYGYYARNCTTFVRDMAKLAHLPVSNKLFELEEVGFSNKANIGRIGADIWGENNLAGMEEGLVSLSEREDQSYVNFGNKRTTQEDFDNFKKSVRGKPSEYKDTYIPASVGEKLRRETSGEIGSQSYKGNITKDDDPGQIMNEINLQGQKLKELIDNQMIPEARRSNKEIPAELENIIETLPQLGDALGVMTDKDSRKLTFAVLMIRDSFSKNIRLLNRLYFQYFKGDKRLHEPVMRLISVLNYGISLMDGYYRQSSIDYADNDFDLGDFPKKINYDNEVKFGDKSIEISPSFYEAYLQIYKTPEKAVNAYHHHIGLINREKELSEKKKKGSLSSREKKELSKAKRMYGLAAEFDKAHRYMTDKENYNQQDVDYAFMLYDRERLGNVQGSMLEDNTAGNTYLALILKKIFGGMRERFKTYLAQNEENKKPENIFNWLDQDMSDSLLKNKDQMLMVVRGLKKSMQNPLQVEDGKPGKKKKEVNEYQVYAELIDKIYLSWINKLFDGKQTDIEKNDQEQLLTSFKEMVGEGDVAANFQNLLKTLIKQVLIEDKLSEDALVKEWNKSNS